VRFADRSSDLKPPVQYLFIYDELVQQYTKKYKCLVACNKLID